MAIPHRHSTWMDMLALQGKYDHGMRLANKWPSHHLQFDKIAWLDCSVGPVLWARGAWSSRREMQNWLGWIWYCWLSDASHHEPRPKLMIVNTPNLYREQIKKHYHLGYIVTSHFYLKWPIGCVLYNFRLSIIMRIVLTSAYELPFRLPLQISFCPCPKLSPRIY